MGPPNPFRNYLEDKRSFRALRSSVISDSATALMDNMARMPRLLISSMFKWIKARAKQ